MREIGVQGCLLRAAYLAVLTQGVVQTLHLLAWADILISSARYGSHPTTHDLAQTHQH